jgi:glyoxylase-like metal-dependent hydrolase (beta-lactamase superfamily II)
MTELTPPTDPRVSWELPPLGSLPPVSRLDEVTVRVLAPNAGPMTLDGTNTYVIAPPGSGEAVIVDPGPTDPSHLHAVADVVADCDAKVRAIIVTHHHHDHTEAARLFSTHFHAPTLAADPAYAVAAPGSTVVETLRDGGIIELSGCHVSAVATPGHTADHLALRLATGALLTGDHILGRGTSVVASPDGDLEAYLDSLHTVLGLGPDMLLPGHGPELAEDPHAVVTFYLAQRAFRTAQIRAVLARGPATPAQIVAEIYAAVDQKLWPAAERSTRAAIAALARQGDVFHDDTDVVRWRG